MKHPSSFLSPGGDVLRPNNTKSVSRSVTSASSRTQSMKSSPLCLTPNTKLHESKSSSKLQSLENENIISIESTNIISIDNFERQSNFIEILTLPSPNLLIKYLFAQSNDLLVESFFLSLYIKAIFSLFSNLISNNTKSLIYWPNILTVSNSNFYSYSKFLASSTTSNLKTISSIDFYNFNWPYMLAFCNEISILKEEKDFYILPPILKSIFKINLANAEKIFTFQSSRLADVFNLIF